MIDLKRDLKVTPEDTKIQEHLRKEGRTLNLEEYLAFLHFVHDFLGDQVLREKVIMKMSSRQIEL